MPDKYIKIRIECREAFLNQILTYSFKECSCETFSENIKLLHKAPGIKNHYAYPRDVFIITSEVHGKITCATSEQIYLYVDKEYDVMVKNNLYAYLHYLQILEEWILKQIQVNNLKNYYDDKIKPVTFAKSPAFFNLNFCILNPSTSFLTWQKRVYEFIKIRQEDKLPVKVAEYQRARGNEIALARETVKHFNGKTPDVLKKFHKIDNSRLRKDIINKLIEV